MITNDIPVRSSDAAAAAAAPAGAAQRALGAILVDAGRLAAGDTEQILRRQREHGQSFGQAAISMGLLTAADVDMGLARQFDFPYLLQGESALSDELVLAYQPFGAQAEALRLLRTELLQRWFGVASGRHALAITSAEAQDGRSFLAANLAVAFSQLGKRTLLIDADLRQPRQHTLFGLPNGMGLSALLSGRAGLSAIVPVGGLPGLSLLTSGSAPPNPAELLARSSFARLLDELAHDYDVVLIDTPAALDCVDARSVAASAGAALVVARKDASDLAAVSQLATTMSAAGIAVLGAVLNDY
ncbi:chain length determinant protein tyrosine kinase EpsG [Massilia sp. PWRC2]|uniref:chain length determinant protein tyrosine kinase EpsG n=1 Tax=Massilia sp. PWRC2 TaxID=2804626 RepID=UPI003CF6E2BC